MSDSEDDYLSNDHIQRILFEAATDLARRERANGAGYLPCGSRSSQHVDNVNNSSNQHMDDSPLVRRSNSSPAIPELGRRIHSFLSVENEPKAAYFYNSRNGDCDDDNSPRSQSERHRRPTKAAFEDSSESDAIPLGPSMDERRHNNSHRSLSSEGSFEKIDLQKIFYENPEGNFVSYDTHDDAQGYREKYDNQQNPPACDNQQDGPVYTVDEAYMVQLQGSDEDSYLEESSERSANRPIVRVMEDEEGPDDVFNESQSPVGPLFFDESMYNRAGGKNQAVAKAELEIVHLRKALHQTREDRKALHKQVLIREREWMHLKARYRAEIRDLRELNTYLMNGSIAEDGDLNQRMVHTLIMAKKDADKALITTFEREQKINELRLLVSSQQQYVMEMEESILELQRTLQEAREQRRKEQGLPENTQDNTQALYPDLPVRRPMDRAVLSGYRDVYQCHRGAYIPGTSTDSELSTTEVFHFPGARRQRTRKKTKSFDMLKVPYVVGAVYPPE